MRAGRLTPTRSGFSLVELVIVMLILGIFAASALTRYSQSLNRFRAENAARTIAADLRLAASEAQRISQTRQVQFDVANDSYTLNGVSDIDFEGQPYAVDLAGSEYSAALTSANFNATDVATFDMYGRPVNAGSVVVQSGAETRTVTLNADGSTSLP